MRFSQRFWRGLVFLSLITALCGGMAVPMLASVQASSRMQAATNIVISEFRTRGPSGGNDDFVELYNPTSSPIDISGWLIRTSNNMAGTNTRYTIPSGTILQSGQHFLIAGSAYTGGVAGETGAVLSSGIPDDGGIALTLGDGITIIDQAGMSLGSAYGEGTRLTPLTTNDNRSYERVYDLSFNCIDSTNNATDFFIRSPSDPQNFSSPVTTCGDPNPLLTSTAGNLTGTASNLTGTAANLTNTAVANLTGTAIANLTGTATSSPTPTSVGSMRVIISEVAWSGTAASSDDEWIELYNPGSSPVNLTGWMLGVDSSNITLAGNLAPGGFFLLERGSTSTDDTTVSDAIANQIYTGNALSNTGGILRLRDPSGYVIDSANLNGGPWPAGTTSGSGTQNYNSMERVVTGGVPRPDSDTAWISNVQSSTWTKHDANNALIRGTPGYGNWAFTVTPTVAPTRSPTPRATPTRTLSPPPPPPLVAINEFVPRPGHDWNNDGVVNVGDEYVELINHGTIDVNLSGYSLDDEVNIGSNPYRLPAITISPGDRIVFYGSETGLLLSDGGDGVRLLSPNGQLTDAYNYRVVRFPDQSFCRLPDNGGLDDWNTNCFPTPGLQNALSGSFVGAPNLPDAESQCPIADTLPIDFILAECPPFGNDIWRASYWDGPGWYGEKYLPESPGKWQVFVD